MRKNTDMKHRRPLYLHSDRGTPLDIELAILHRDPRMKVPPTFLHQDHLDYLDRLEETGLTNMHGAAPYLRLEFPSLSVKQARHILCHWMATFEERHPH